MFSYKVKGRNGQQGRNFDDRETLWSCRYLKRPCNSANDLTGEGGLACDQVYASFSQFFKLLVPQHYSPAYLGKDSIPDPGSTCLWYSNNFCREVQTRSKNTERRNADPPHSRLHQVQARQVGNVRIFIAQLDQWRMEDEETKRQTVATDGSTDKYEWQGLE